MVSAICIGTSLALFAVVALWAAPRFGLNVTTQIVVGGVILLAARTFYFLALDFNDDQPVGPPQESDSYRP